MKLAKLNNQSAEYKNLRNKVIFQIQGNEYEAKLLNVLMLQLVLLFTVQTVLVKTSLGNKNALTTAQNILGVLDVLGLSTKTMLMTLKLFGKKLRRK